MAEKILELWAVLKGPSTVPSEKRPAVPTEDHPLDRLRFEGLVPVVKCLPGTVRVRETPE